MKSLKVKRKENLETVTAHIWSAFPFFSMSGSKSCNMFHFLFFFPSRMIHISSFFFILSSDNSNEKEKESDGSVKEREENYNLVGIIIPGIQMQIKVMLPGIMPTMINFLLTTLGLTTLGGNIPLIMRSLAFFSLFNKPTDWSHERRKECCWPPKVCAQGWTQGSVSPQFFLYYKGLTVIIL